MLRTAFLYIALTLAACSSGKIAREVKKDTEEKLKSPVTLTAKGGDYTFNLHENSFFDYQGRSQFYAGTFKQEGDTLMLAFHNNHKPEDLIGKALMRRNEGRVVLLAKEASDNRVLLIQQ